MPPKNIQIQRAFPNSESASADFIALLRDAVNGGASLGFLRPLKDAVALAYWLDVFTELASRTRVLLVATDSERVVGAVQLSLCTRENGLHRAEVQKLMVHTSARRQGIGRALMNAAETEARLAGRNLLYLDTEPGRPAEKMYEALGWTRAGEIPGYACSPDGHLHGTAIFYRNLIAKLV